MTLGARGVVAVRGGQRIEIAAPSVAVVDTVGAGDAFVGAFAAALGRDLSLEVALRQGVAAGSLACMQHGAQTALPDQAAIDALLADMTAFEPNVSG